MLAALNLGRDMGGGMRFVDPDQLRAGWHLRLPADARAADTDASTRGPDGRTRRAPEGPGHCRSSWLSAWARSPAPRWPGGRGAGADLGARFTEELGIGPAPSDGALDAATLLDRFTGVPALHSFEAANCLLGRSLHGRDAGPRVRAICVSPSGVTFWLAGEEPGPPPAGFVPVRDGAAWHVEHGALDVHDLSLPYLPVVLPIGDDDDGTWLVPLEPGDVLPLLGERAPALWRAARAAAGSWAWSDTVLDLRGPRGSGYPLRGRGRAGAGPTRPLLRRSALAPGGSGAALRRRHDGAGGGQRPDRPGRPPGAPPSIPWAGSSGPTSRRRRRPATSRSWWWRPPTRGPHAAGGSGDRAPTAPRRGTAALAPGAVDVRLLAMTPRLDGLRENLPPNRARRAVELVAYLALHQPDVITSDRLRTRVLGSSDADAASKTLFNTAYAARRAMGVDERGEPLFPAGDAQRPVPALAPGHGRRAPRRGTRRRGQGAGRPRPRHGLLPRRARARGGRAAGQRAVGLLVVGGRGPRWAYRRQSWSMPPAPWPHWPSDAGPLRSGPLGAGAGAGRRALQRGALAAAMQLAAAEGDADRLRHEWRECQRRVDALDPGCSPSSRTESLYGELSRRVLVEAARPTAAPTPYEPAPSD